MISIFSIGNPPNVIKYRTPCTQLNHQKYPIALVLSKKVSDFYFEKKVWQKIAMVKEKSLRTYEPTRHLQ